MCLVILISPPFNVTSSRSLPKNKLKKSIDIGGISTQEGKIYSNLGPFYFHMLLTTGGFVIVTVHT